MQKYLWLKVTKDKYEFPIAIADTAKELAKATGVSVGTVKKMIYQIENKQIKRSQYRRVPI